MVNEGINATIGIMQEISFESWTEITTSIPFIIAMLVAWLIPIVLYLIIVASVHARTTNGTILKTRLISRSETLIPLGIWIFVQGALILTFIVIPLWLKFCL